MGPVLVILVLIPEHNVAGLCSDIIQILDPFLIIHTLDKFPVIERFNDLIYVIVIKPCNRCAAGSEYLVLVNVTRSYNVFFGIIILGPVVIPVTSEIINSTERQSEHKAYKTVAAKIMFLITICVIDAPKSFAVPEDSFNEQFLGHEILGIITSVPEHVIKRMVQAFVG